jgi:hypothetical protein
LTLNNQKPHSQWGESQKEELQIFKLAIGAGHYLGTAGRRVPAALDPVSTKEWQLNNRVAGYVAEAVQ